MLKKKWRMGPFLTTSDVVTELLHGNPVYWNGKWYHHRFIENWTFIVIKRSAQKHCFRMAIKEEEVN